MQFTEHMANYSIRVHEGFYQYGILLRRNVSQHFQCQSITVTWTCFTELKYIIYNFKLASTGFCPLVWWLSCRSRSEASPAPGNCSAGTKEDALAHIISHVTVLVILDSSVILLFIFIHSLSRNNHFSWMALLFLDGIYLSLSTVCVCVCTEGYTESNS